MIHNFKTQARHVDKTGDDCLLTRIKKTAIYGYPRPCRRLLGSNLNNYELFISLAKHQLLTFSLFQNISDLKK
jgi:hypothetical protein